MEKDGVKIKQEDYQSKLTRDMYNFHHGSGNESTLMVETTMEMETLLLKDIMELVTSILMNFKDSSKDEEGKLAYKSMKTINFFPSNSCSCFEIYLEEIKLFSLVLRENGYEFYLLNSLDPLMSSGVKFDPSCYGFGKHVEQCDYVLPILGVFLKNINGFILFNQHVIFLNKQIAFVSGKHELSIVVTTFETFLKTHSVSKFYNLHFKEVLLKDFENQMEAILELFKIMAWLFTWKNALKIKLESFEDKGHVSMLLIIRAINKDYSMEQLGCKDSRPNLFKRKADDVNRGT
ncbi:hypothetical protein M9H77_07543 [Catharanthus roseus]|uniref:Uncharacterized protein n=1 Tax=Catharanthus roseus TaxID=4058 RepID=A0ACC0BVI0_CATRO|nr:hypothetical protein M9H77_07543 [Catharanthus roseus]